MKTYTLPRKTLLLWRIRAAYTSLILMFICYLLPLPLKWTLIICTVILFLFSTASLWYLPKFIKGCRITVSNGAVIIKRGVLIENTHILPFSRLIHSQLIQTPVTKLISLNMVLLKAARFRIFVPEMSEKDAESLMADISAEEGL